MQISFLRELFRSRNHRIGTVGTPRYRKKEIENQYWGETNLPSVLKEKDIEWGKKERTIE